MKGLHQNSKHNPKFAVRISNYLYFTIYTKCQILRETVSFVFPRVLGLKGKENELVS